jgi:hypothetical protein
MWGSFIRRGGGVMYTSLLVSGPSPVNALRAEASCASHHSPNPISIARIPRSQVADHDCPEDPSESTRLFLPCQAGRRFIVLTPSTARLGKIIEATYKTGKPCMHRSSVPL